MTTIALIAPRNTRMPREWIPRLTNDLRRLTLQAPTQFYVGAEGRFNRAMHRILEELAKQSDRVQFAVVLSSVSISTTNLKLLPPHADMLIPAGIENVPPHLRIIKRDEWMIRRSQIVITCVENTMSNAHRFMEYARKHGKIVMNIPEVYAGKAE